MKRYQMGVALLCLAVPACSKHQGSSVDQTHAATQEANKSAQESTDIYGGYTDPRKETGEWEAASPAEREKMGLPPATPTTDKRATAAADGSLVEPEIHTNQATTPTHGNPPGTYTAPGTVKAVAPSQGTWTKGEVMKGTDTVAGPRPDAHQGTSDSDRRTTQRIRSSLLDDDSLSYTAKNVQISTLNGDITLRGQVLSDKERWEIERKARGYAGSGRVFNDLAIKSQPMPAP